MYAVIFEVKPTSEGKEEYLAIAASLREFLEGRDGFISIERFQSLTDEGKVLSLSFWRDEQAIRIDQRDCVADLLHRRHARREDDRAALSVGVAQQRIVRKRGRGHFVGRRIEGFDKIDGRFIPAGG